MLCGMHMYVVTMFALQACQYLSKKKMRTSNEFVVFKFVLSKVFLDFADSLLILIHSTYSLIIQAQKMFDLVFK